jgi:hypothetical protein
MTGAEIHRDLPRAAGIYGCDAAPRPARFAEIVSDDFPLLHRIDLASS